MEPNETPEQDPNFEPTDDLTGSPGGDGSIRILPINIEEEMRSSYIDYSMSVIVSRALPDVRDGLKPVQRRVLYGMSELGLASNRAHRKSARIVGEVLGKYHPHGDQSVYQAMVRMAQDFSMRYMLVDGQGNFGSVDGDAAAAMRYTEARMTAMAEAMLRDLPKETVDFAPNFDDSLEEPTVFPAALPNLLMNGASGIAVGMATNIPPHNLTELVNGIVALIDDPELSIDELTQHITAPDFPTGGVIYGYGGVKQAYRTGNGRCVIRAKIHEEELAGGRLALIVTEIPYQVNKSTLIEKIAQTAREKRVEGIHDLRDESDRDGMRIVIELKKDAVSAVVQNQLFKYTQLQQTFGINTVALVGGRPKTLTLKELVQHYVDHRHEVVLRRTRFDLRKAEERAHILEGLSLALDHLDEIIAIIRHSEDTDAAKANLMKGVYPQRLTPEARQRLGLAETSPVERSQARESRLFEGQEEVDERFVPQPWLSEAQAEAILALRLSRLTGLEREKILGEYREILQEIERLRALLASRPLRMETIKEELIEMRDRFGDERRTAIDYTGGGDIDIEDLIEDEPVVVTISHQGLVKRTAVSEYRQQGRGGRGLIGAGTRDEDYVEHLFMGSTHDWLLFFTDHGRCYWLRVYSVPEGSRTARGRSIRNLIQIAQDDRIRAVLAVKKADFASDAFLASHFVLMATKQGQVKKTALEAFSRPRADGIIAIDVVDGDELLEAHLTDGDTEVVLAATNGRAIRFHETDVRAMGRNTRGVRGMNLGNSDEVVGMVAMRREAASVLTVSERGYGKRSPLEDYRTQTRGGKGILTMKTTSKTGKLVAIKSVVDGDDLMIVTQNGITIRMRVADIREMGRNTQGVRVINLKDGDRIADVTRLVLENGDLAALEEATDDVLATGALPAAGDASEPESDPVVSE
jgi:DNA gyrase subunit A